MRLHEQADVVHLRALALAGDDESHALEGLGRPDGELVTVRVGGDPRAVQELLRDPLIQRVAAGPGDGQQLLGGDMVSCVRWHATP